MATLDPKNKRRRSKGQGARALMLPLLLIPLMIPLLIHTDPNMSRLP